MTGGVKVAKASEIARKRITKADSTKWLAAVIGFVVATGCAFAATMAGDAVGFWSLLATAVAAMALPTVVAMYAMRENSAEFKGAWLMLLAVVILAWSSLAVGFKRAQGILAMQSAVSHVAEFRSKHLAAFEAGRTQDLGEPPALSDSANPFFRTQALIVSTAWRHAESQSRYRQKLNALGREREIDMAAMRDPDTRRKLMASQPALLAAIQVWSARERRIQTEFVSGVRAAGLPLEFAQRFEGTVKRAEDALDWRLSAEKDVAEAMQSMLEALDQHRWTSGKQGEKEALTFATNEGLMAFRSAQIGLERAVRHSGWASERVDQSSDEMFIALGALQR
jgi:hypothetical protein